MRSFAARTLSQLAIGVSAITLAVPGAAAAQDVSATPSQTPGTPQADETPAQQSNDDPVNQEPGEDPANTEGEVVVTADRRNQTLQNYAGTAAVLSPDQLLKVGITDIDSLNDVLPGLRVQNFGGQVFVALRGIGTNQGTELGDPNVATHFDEVYVPRVQGLSNAFFDLRSVEVNFGPQGTLRGRNASAGSLNFISNTPELGKFAGSLEAAIGSFHQRNLRGVLNVPLVGDILALRLSGSVESFNSNYNNVGRFPDVEPPGAATNRGVRAQLLFEPSKSLSILVAGDLNDQDSTGYNGANFSTFLGEEGDFAENVASVKNPRDILTGPLGEKYFTKHNGIRTRVTYRTEGLFNVQYIGSYRDLRFGNDGSGPIGVAFPNFEEEFYGGAVGAERLDNFGQGTGRGSSRSDFHEVRLFNDKEPFKYSLGGNYFNERQRTFSASVADYNSFFQGQEFNTRTKSEAYAFYGDGTYSVTKDLRVTGGLRYTNDRKSRTGVIARNFFGGGAADFGCCGYFRLGTPGFEFNRDRTIFNPDRNNDGNITPGEQLLFFLDGVKSFGARDTIPLAFGSAIARLNANPALASDPNFPLALPGEAIPGCINSARNPGYQCRADGTFSYIFVANTINNQGSAIKTDFFDFRARLEYDITPDNLVYGVISRGHKAASFNDNLGPLGPAPFFRPESVTLYELGAKNEFTLFGRPAVLNLSAFYNDYKDQQLTALLGVQSIIAQITGPDGTLIDVAGPQVLPNDFNQNQVVAFTYNAANSETYGIQGSGSVILPYSFKLGADFLFLEAKVKDAEPVVDFRFQADVNGTDSVERPIAGRRLPYAPKLQLNASLAKVFAISGPLEGLADVLVSVSYRSGSFATIFNSVDFAFENKEVFATGPNAGQIRVTTPRASLNDRIPSYALVNLAAGFTHRQFRIEGFANNLFDKTVAAGLLVSQFSNTRFFTGPRVLGARVRVNF